MKLCVIGGTGQQGYQQVLAGLEQGFEVVAVGQSRALSREAKLKMKNLAGKKLTSQTNRKSSSHCRQLIMF